MKKSLFILFIIFVALPAFSQQMGEVSFAYDANGNRISRSLEFKKIRENGRDVECDSPSFGKISDSVGFMEVSIYPNPTQDRVFIRVESGAFEVSYSVSLSTSSGVKLYERRMSRDLESIDLSEQAAGVYFLELCAGEERHVWKVIKR